MVFLRQLSGARRLWRPLERPAGILALHSFWSVAQGPAGAACVLRSVSFELGRQLMRYAYGAAPKERTARPQLSLPAR